MGKVLKLVAVVAVAAAIAYFAPGIGLGLLKAVGVTAVAGSAAAFAATVAVSTALGIAASLAFRVFAGPPSATTSVFYQWPQGAPVVDQTMVAPRSPGWWRDPLFLPWGRFRIDRATGDCLKGIFDDRWFIVDRLAPISVGDLVLLRVPDQARYFWTPSMGFNPQRIWWRLFAPAMVKRFQGIAGDRLLFDHTNPQRAFETDDVGVRTLYRIVATSPTLAGAVRAWWQFGKTENGQRNV